VAAWRAKGGLVCSVYNVLTAKRRINGWDEMTEIEKARVLLGKKADLQRGKRGRLEPEWAAAMLGCAAEEE
jgi:hypothetical protein